MPRKIKHISFLYKEERLIIAANNHGKFKVPVTNGSKTRYKFFTAREVLELNEIKAGDPSLTMECGEKLRVYQGGDPSYLPASVEGILLSHDSMFKTKPKVQFSSPRKNSDDYDDLDQQYFDWYGDSHGF